ncbi:MAG: efflux RND transporter periplasmic adaptor subunit, partial [Candidatus Kapaibacterium sp.]
QEEVVNFQVRIRIIDPEGRMRPGMSCSVDIETETKPNVLAVPIQSVTIMQDVEAQTKDEDYRKTERKAEGARSKRPQSIVWVTDGAKVTARAVTTGISDEGYIEITNGIRPGERVVSGPYEAISKVLKPGAKVAVEDAAQRKERYREMRQAQ